MINAIKGLAKVKEACIKVMTGLVKKSTEVKIARYSPKINRQWIKED